MAAYRFPVFWTCVLASALLAGCNRSGDPHVVKIVSSLPRTGAARQQTDTIVNGIRMALEDADNKVD